jgi:hypothetical protein
MNIVGAARFARLAMTNPAKPTERRRPGQAAPKLR